MDLSDKVYVALKPNERFQAAVAAAARQDGDELDRIIDTCEQKTYRMPDADFWWPLREFGHLAEWHNGRITRLALVASNLLLLVNHLEGDPERHQERLDRVDDAFTKAVGAANAMRGAWLQFCEELGISSEDAETFSGMHEGGVSTILDVVMAGDIPPDEAKLAGHLEDLRARWVRKTAERNSRTSSKAPRW